MTAPLIVIIGETASGKSALALQLSQHLGGEILCADAWTVYKDFDVGTAKPTAAERALITHHLLDIADPAQGFSAAIFKRLAVEQITDTASRGRLPILVGGTGLYIDSVLYDYEFLPPPSDVLRRELNTLDLEALLARASGLGLDTSVVDQRNKRRIIRLIENNGRIPGRKDMRPNTLILGLRPNRELLVQRISMRVDAMLKAGLQQEVARLAERYGWDAEPMKGIGYREFRLNEAEHPNIEQVRQAIIRNTIALAKKQRTWFKRNKSIHWLTTDDKVAEAVDIATTFLNK
ncbi:MAG TPA: tRNA (adenosine(37)-N6)-dimethylallyltransferase MiaA [Candidatus Saccharimonadales bacterium]|jgi:tRNA dimethylallyltransferase